MGGPKEALLDGSADWRHLAKMNELSMCGGGADLYQISMTTCYGRPVEKGRPLYFCPVVSSCIFVYLFTSPNLSHRRLDVCHTSTHGVALVQI